MGVFTTLAVIGAGLAIGGAVMSYNAQKKSAKAQMAQQKNQRRRSARQNIRQAQIARASVVAGAVGSGAAGGSGAIGGAGGVGSRLGDALGYSSQQSHLSGIISSQNQRASLFSGIAGIGGNLFSLGGGGQSLRNAFGGGGGGYGDVAGDNIQ